MKLDSGSTTADYEVEVLLATYNGEKFLPELLSSLLSQRNCRIHLTVSDDGSSDRTLEILREFAPSFTSFALYRGPQAGATKNFFHLVRNIRTRHPIAFCDQDDVWEMEKLQTALVFIDRTKPYQLYFSKVHTIPKQKIYPKSFEIQAAGIAARNSAMGCTQVLSNDLARLIARTAIPAQVHFDWWVLMIAFLVGDLIPDNESHISYRLHSENAIGIPKVSIRVQNYLWRLISTNFDFKLPGLSGLIHAIQECENLELTINENALLFLRKFQTCNKSHFIRQKYYLWKIAREMSNPIYRFQFRILLLSNSSNNLFFHSDY